MEDLKKAWVQAGKSMVIAAADLGASLVTTAKFGFDKAVEWARKDNPHINTEGHEVAADAVETGSTDAPNAE